jgi:hypothetical protein
MANTAAIAIFMGTELQEPAHAVRRRDRGELPPHPETQFACAIHHEIEKNPRMPAGPWPEAPPRSPPEGAARRELTGMDGP